jgi:hypothetical protein
MWSLLETTSVWLEIFPYVFLEELPGMPPDTEVEFVIDLLPGTVPISKRPYMMSCRRVKRTQEALNGVARGWVHSSESSPWRAPVLFVKKKDGLQGMCVD